MVTLLLRSFIPSRTGVPVDVSVVEGVPFEGRGSRIEGRDGLVKERRVSRVSERPGGSQSVEERERRKISSLLTVAGEQWSGSRDVPGTTRGSCDGCGKNIWEEFNGSTRRGR